MGRLLDEARPAAALAQLDARRARGEAEGPEQLLERAEALLELDCAGEAQPILEAAFGDAAAGQGPDGPLPPRCYGQAGALLAQTYLRLGAPDLAALAAASASAAIENEQDTPALEARALALGWGAAALAAKRCWGLSRQRLHLALELAPDLPRLLAAQARVRLEADQRLEARRVYERLAGMPGAWAQLHAGWGRSYVAYLLGEFEQAERLSIQALTVSAEAIFPLYVLAQVALARADLSTLQNCLDEISRRSPQAQSLPWYQHELARLRASLHSPGAPVEARSQGEAQRRRRRRLEAFPTLVQRRNYCGPATVELVLRYWRDGQGLDGDQIAAQVKLPQGGTPIYRMREFFHLAGFDTLRCRAPAPVLYRLIDAGYPAILQQEFSNSSHVVVAIGYDQDAGALELQDPMTHAISTVSVAELQRSRRVFLEAALVAFPQGRGHEQRLARLGIFDDAALVWADRAVQELEHGRPVEAAELCERAVLRQPDHAFSWILLLEANLELWRRALYPAARAPLGRRHGLAARLQAEYPNQGEAPAEARSRYLNALRRARLNHPQSEFIHHFQGEAALLDGQYPAALRAFEQAAQVDADDARSHAARAQCLYALRRFEPAVQAAWRALELDPGQPQANAWMGRALAAQGQSDAVHYAAAAFDLDPNLPLTALALAESCWLQADLPAARRLVEQALTLAPGDPEPLALHGLLLIEAGEPAAAAQQLELALAGPLPLAPALVYRARQGLYRLALQAGLSAEAATQIQSLLDEFPDDAWALRCQAVIQSELLLADLSAQDRPPEPQELAFLDQLFCRALQANAGEPQAAAEYAHYTSLLVEPAVAASLLAELRRQYPQQGGLLYWHGLYLAEAGQAAAAAETMLEALAQPQALHDESQLLAAARCVVQYYGCRQAELRWRAVPFVGLGEGGAGPRSRRRALGLALAQAGSDCAERAVELLQQALRDRPDDSPALLALADITAEAGPREALYRQTLLLAPDWAQARAHLARHLVACGRARAALEFTSGYTEQDVEIFQAHAAALLAAGYYEEAAEAFARLLEQADEPEVELYAGRWEAEMRSGRLELALQTARWALERFPRQVEWHLRQAETLRRLGRHAEAAQAVGRGRKLGLDEAEALRAEYFAAMARTDRAAAAQAIERLLLIQQQRRREQAGDGRLGWAEAQQLRLLLEAGQSGEALAWLENERLDAQGWGDAAWIALSFGDEGGAEAASDPAVRAALALQLAQRALSLEPDNFAGLLAQSQALDDLDQPDQALAALNRMRSAHPEEHNAYEKLALRSLARQNLSEAAELAERAVTLGPFCPLAWAVRGAVNYLQDRRPAALADLQAAWNRADPQRRRQYALYWWLLHNLQGEEEAAGRYYRQARKQARTHLEKHLLAVLKRGLA